MTYPNPYHFTVTADESGEPRVFDLDVAEALDFERPRKIRDLIERNRLELERYGSLHHHRANPGARGGRPAYEYRLNEGQALLIATFSRTSRAADIRQALIQTFLDWRAGKTIPVRPHRRTPPVRTPQRAAWESLPFVTMNGDHASSLWSVESSGNYNRDRRAGTGHADELIRYVARSGDGAFAGLVARDIMRRGQWTGVEGGFFQRLAEGRSPGDNSRPLLEASSGEPHLTLAQRVERLEMLQG